MKVHLWPCAGVVITLLTRVKLEYYSVEMYICKTDMSKQRHIVADALDV